MFSKTFFSRLKHANDVTFLTGPELTKSLNYPELKNFNFRDSSKIKKEDFLENAMARAELSNWLKNDFTSLRPTLGHYSFLDMQKKLSNLHLMTLCSSALHQAAGIERVMELNGSYKETREEAGEKIPAVRFKDEDINSETLSDATEVAAVCEVFILCGVTEMDDKVSSLPFLAKGNGCYMAEISEEETEMTRHCNESLKGDVSDWLTKISMIMNKVF